MALESLVEWIQANPVQTELMAIQLSGVAILGYVFYACSKEQKDKQYTHNNKILEQSDKPKDKIY